MPTAQLEERAAAVIHAGLRNNVILSKEKAAWLPGYIAESILVELLTPVVSSTSAQQQDAPQAADTQQSPSTILLSDLPDDVEQAIQTWGALLVDNLDDVEQDDVASFCQQLLNGLTELAKEEEERWGQGMNDDDEGEAGACEMCARVMPLTKHHLIPRDVHKLWKQRGATFDELQAGLMICRTCHNAVHRVADNKSLAQDYNTLDKLLLVSSIQKHISWARKQKVVVKPDRSNIHKR